MSDQLPGTSGPAADATAVGGPTPSGPAVKPAGAAQPTPSGPLTAGASKGPAASGGDWTVQVTDRVESVVAAVRDKTTVPITKIARIVVFGLLAAVVGLIALVLLIIVLVRLIDVYLPFAPYGRRVWVGYAGLGAIFVLAGAFSWSKRTRKPQEIPQ
jgi:hypothetical protein